VLVILLLVETTFCIAVASSVLWLREGTKLLGRTTAWPRYGRVFRLSACAVSVCRFSES
jgi:hypothetical protein